MYRVVKSDTYFHFVGNLVNFIVIGIFINKNTYIIPTEAYVTYRSVKDTDNVSRHFFLLMYTRKPQRAPAGGYISTVSCHSNFDPTPQKMVEGRRVGLSLLGLCEYFYL